jgi:polyferredoxin
MKTARRISQLCFFIFFLILFFQTARHINWTDGSMDVSAWGPADFFLRIDPLLGWTSLLSSGSFLLPVALWTLPVLVLTLLFGRMFCGWICPLGTSIDGADKLVRHRNSAAPTGRFPVHASSTTFWRDYSLRPFSDLNSYG